MKNTRKTPQDLAVGASEAAALMRVHFTQPSRMAARGLIRQQTLSSGWSTSECRQAAVYSSRDCLENWQEYQSAKGTHIGRPRTAEGSAEEVLNHLKRSPQITFNDAIGTGDAAKILDVHPTLVNAWMAEGRVEHRFPWSPRGDGVRSHSAILSKKSVEALRRRLLKEEREGTKKGPKRRLRGTD